jgi:conjugative relaxase-like TrwC/TraI family protein
MLSSAKIGTSSWRYYTDGVACRATEYYAGVGEAPGRWHGRGLEHLGLKPGAVVSERELEALFARGLHPTTGVRLGRAWRTDGVTGFDLTFSAPKSVSALWALGDSSTASATAAAHRAAVRAGLAYLDGHAALSRRGTDGVEQVSSGGLAAALFDHRTSRAGDPQLHTHALVLNKVRCTDGRWRTLDAAELFHHKKSAGMIYQAALRNELYQRLGIVFSEVNEHGQADIVGVPDELLSLWSKRTASIDAEAGPKIVDYEKLLGRALSASERVGVVKTAVLKTRKTKQHAPLSALHVSWVAEAERAGWTPERLRKAVRIPAGRGRAVERRRWAADPAGLAGLAEASGPVLPTDLAGRGRPAEAGQPVVPAGDRSGPQRPEPVLPTALPAGAPVLPAVLPAEELALPAGVAAAALQAAGLRRAVFSRADVAGQVAAHLPTSGLSAEQVLARVAQLTDAALALADAVPIGQRPQAVTARASDDRYATVQVLSAEARILSLASRGRRGGYGQVLHSALMPAGRDGRLDPGQYGALLRLAGGGDFLSVLTAPAGAGKTSTLGAAAQAWQQAGYRVLGLAPSARAAAELAAATGDGAETLAKWLHSHDRASSAGKTQGQAAGWAELDDRTVVIVDEASMASTPDLDRLTDAAARAAAKVVLVGDPAQIGVINGPGGMLAALSHAGHGVVLQQIHRFAHAWERQASLALRTGQPGALGGYQSAGRLHSCQNGEQALDAVFGHWQRARADGQDVLMLARTRVDVDALNARARAAALAAGDVSGQVTTAGDRQWQAGDLLRTRRNDRRLSVGDGHVRNGDRYRVLGPGPQDGLIVEDLTGRGRLVLPAKYLAAHADYGWASTIDAAQGATADVGIVLVRPGLDREHLYVGLTRGRQANHAYITPDATGDDDHPHHHGQRPHERAGSGRAGAAGREQQEAAAAMRVLEAALSRSGAQDAAHTALDQARALATHTAREAECQAEREAERQAERQAAVATGQRRPQQGRPLTPEHALAAQQLEQRRAERDQLRAERAELHRTLQQARAQHDALPRWARGRRNTLTEVITISEQRLQQTEPTQATLDAEIDRLSRQVAHHTRQRLTHDLAPHRHARPAAWDLTRDGKLARPQQIAAAERDRLGIPPLVRDYRGPQHDLGGVRSR